MTEIIRSLTWLNPEFQRRVIALEKDLAVSYETGLTKTNFKIFETFRSPERQKSLVTKGASKAGAWHSAHQWGFAVDFVPYISVEDSEVLGREGVDVVPGWNWHPANDYRFLAARAKLVNLAVPIAWDLVHVESPDWPAYHTMLKRFVIPELK